MDNKVVSDLHLGGSSLTGELKEQLAIGQVSGQTYSPEDHRFLKDTLGMTSCSKTRELEAKRKVVELTSVKMTVVKEFDDIRKNLGDRVILDYKGLLKICNDHNLYFGHSSLFNGDMTDEAIAEAKVFNFDKARTILRIGRKQSGQPVINWDFRGATAYDLIIVAPITMFELNSLNKVLISNREIIEHPKGQSPRVKVKPCTQDPVLLMPFRSADDRIYFLLITNW